MNDSHDAGPAGDSAMADPEYGSDGALDRVLRMGHKAKFVPAIFIHAGAGFHSHQNEHIHLEACVAAAEMGMRLLKAGATAAEAIEASLRILEDKEITNAGYGSNLSIDGNVECDATIVDHLGRSGACGAVPNIRNPISLAKLILDLSNKPLSLRRVPPNALVGEGARVFAIENGITTFGNEYLVSKNARDRFLRWQDDLKRAEGKAQEAKLGATQGYEVAARDPQHHFPRDHAAAIMAGTWNEGQPDSPYTGTPGTPVPEGASAESLTSSYFKVASSPCSTGKPSLHNLPDRVQMTPSISYVGREGFPTPRATGLPRKSDMAAHAVSRSNVISVQDPKATSYVSRAKSYSDATTGQTRQLKQADSIQNDSASDEGSSAGFAESVKRRRSSGTDSDELNRRPGRHSFRPDGPEEEEDDVITDTIGAIAIDEKGHIAAGSSSGGIGMKHQGRLGPAALVGIGTAVVPAAEDDEDGVTVAAVTSGTGEHMATTMASQRCAERIYRGTRRAAGGGDIQDDDEDAIMESFITDDFMDHPGVKNCNSAGAIGVMVVKKMRSGYYFYFAHNTDSFALASYGGAEKEPLCTMSRLSKGAKIAKGGRKIRFD